MADKFSLGLISSFLILSILWFWHGLGTCACVNQTTNHNILITPSAKAMEAGHYSSLNFASLSPFFTILNTRTCPSLKDLNFDKICKVSRINYITAFSVLSHQNAELSSCTFVAVPGCIRTADQNSALTIAFTGEIQYKRMAYGTDTSCFQPYFI